MKRLTMLAAFRIQEIEFYIMRHFCTCGILAFIRLLQVFPVMSLFLYINICSFIFQTEQLLTWIRLPDSKLQNYSCFFHYELNTKKHLEIRKGSLCLMTLKISTFLWRFLIVSFSILDIYLSLKLDLLVSVGDGVVLLMWHSPWWVCSSMFST